MPWFSEKKNNNKYEQVWVIKSQHQTSGLFLNESKISIIFDNVWNWVFPFGLLNFDSSLLLSWKQDRITVR